nr:MAG TPA: hypothetical protein [Caudoviricetes sp.]
MGHLFYLFHFILIKSFYFFPNPNKKPNPAPAHNNNYAILSIRFAIRYIDFYIMLLLYMLSFIFFQKNNTKPAPPVLLIIQPRPLCAIVCVCRYYIIIYIV